MSDKQSGEIPGCTFRLCSLCTGYFRSRSDISQEDNWCKYHFQVHLRIRLVGIVSNSNFQLYLRTPRANNRDIEYCQSHFGISQRGKHYMWYFLLRLRIHPVHILRIVGFRFHLHNIQVDIWCKSGHLRCS